MIALMSTRIESLKLWQYFICYIFLVIPAFIVTGANRLWLAILLFGLMALFGLAVSNRKDKSMSTLALTIVSISAYWTSHLVWQMDLQQTLLGWPLEPPIAPFSGVKLTWFFAIPIYLVYELIIYFKHVISKNGRNKILAFILGFSMFCQALTVYFIYYSLSGV